MMDRLTKRDVNGIAYIDHGHCEAAANMQAIQRLAGIEDALERGELVRVPCKDGVTVYVIRPNSDVFKSHPEIISLPFKGLHWMAKVWGETVFSTRAEAEAVLEKEGFYGAD